MDNGQRNGLRNGQRNGRRNGEDRGRPVRRRLFGRDYEDRVARRQDDVQRNPEFLQWRRGQMADARGDLERRRGLRAFVEEEDMDEYNRVLAIYEDQMVQDMHDHDFYALAA